MFCLISRLWIYWPIKEPAKRENLLYSGAKKTPKRTILITNGASDRSTEQFRRIDHALRDIHDLEPVVHRGLAQEFVSLLVIDAALLHQNALRALDPVALVQLQPGHVQLFL